MMTVKGAKQAVSKLSLVKFFPAGPDARAALMEELPLICDSDEKADWLAQRVCDLHQEWPGLSGVYQVWFSKYPPRNERERQIDNRCGSTLAFPDGIPSETGRQEMAPIPLNPAQERRLLGEFINPNTKALPAPKRGDSNPTSIKTHAATRDEGAKAELGTGEKLTA